MNLNIFKFILLAFALNGVAFSALTQIEKRDKNSEAKLLTYSASKKMAYIKEEMKVTNEPKLSFLYIREFVKSGLLLGQSKTVFDDAKKLIIHHPKRDFLESLIDSLAEEPNLPVEKDYSVVFEKIERELHTAKGKKKAQLLFSLANLYDNIKDTPEAFRLIKEALALDKNYDYQNLFNQLESKIDPKPTMASYLRNWNKKQNMGMSFKTSVERDSNVVLEQIDPTAPTNKKDTSVNNILSLEKYFSLKPLGFEQSLGYSYALSNYTQHSELDSASHTLSYQSSKPFKYSHGLLNVFSMLSFTHFESAKKRLLKVLAFTPGIFYFNAAQKRFYALNASVQKTYYYVDRLSQQGGENYSMEFKFSQYLKKIKSLNFSFKQTFEQTKDASLRYPQSELNLSADINLPKKLWFETTTPYIDYYFRDYSNTSRKDNQFKAGLGLNKPFFENHELEASLYFIENDSTVSVNHYRKNAFSLSYSIDF